jgi:hypothetical protein
MGLCMVDLDKSRCFHGVMKADLRISIKEYRRNKNLKILLFRTPFATRQYYVRMNPDSSGQAAAAWPKDRRAVPLRRWLTGLRKALVRAG